MSNNKNNTPRIGILTHNYPTYKNESKDAGKFIYSFSHELAKQTNVFVLCPEYGKKRKSNNTDVPITWFDWGSNGEKFGSWSCYSPLSFWKFLKLFKAGNKAVLEFVDRNKIDYILSFWNLPSGVFALYSFKRLGIPYSTWALGSDIYIYAKIFGIKQLIQTVLKNADKVYGNSYDICKIMNKMAGVNAEFLPTSNPINLKFYKKTKINKNIFNFLYLARLEKVKGPDILIDAAKILVETRRDFTINMIGLGSMYEYLKKLIKIEKLDDNINLLGYIEDQSLVNGYLVDSDCLIIPSRSESFPLVITEALQTGIPIIGSNVGDIPKFIGGNHIGLVFQKNNPKELADCMEKMIVSAKTMRRVNKAKMLKLSEKFKLENILNKFLSSISYET